MTPIRFAHSYTVALSDGPVVIPFTILRRPLSEGMGRYSSACIEEHIIFVDSGLKAIELVMQDVSRTIFAVFLDLKLREADGLEVLRFYARKPTDGNDPSYRHVRF
jgi:CheY-like chemotaxis protein